MSESLLLVLLLVAVAVAIVLLVLLLLRRPDTSLEQALRAEQREGRGELRQQLDSLSVLQEQRIGGFGTQLQAVAAQTDARLGEFTARTDARLDELRAALGEDARKARHEGSESLRTFTAALDARIAELARNNEARLGEMRTTLESQLQKLQADNAAKLEQMRATVDEKLQSTLETRLGESFRLVSERLEQVQRGLGEMQQLATGVGDLKRVLTNVKTRGIFGEVQLAALLEQILLPEQYQANCAPVPGRNERVEFAVRLPGADDGTPMWLPIDAKFPREDYERLLDAQEHADTVAAAEAGIALERAIRLQARQIRDKYLSPPFTTDYALLFLPTEGLFAEVLRRPGLMESMQRELRVVLTGPTTLAAVLNSLRMGFQTLAIQRRSGEVRELLSAVKTEFGKFGDTLTAVRKSLDAASNKLGKAESKSRTIERHLRNVEALPADTSQRLLELDPHDDEA
ncbi:DNA recombination protein RmuC [Lysobacter solisilvae (ex Woo and Kim 2020)]|uniref:DNA recombination protein RmuC n=1 Tax=Agrilutibacter terrestris TaxID=2865112 RepID=A0A7H0G1G7_9GAMM|nr:DNA recombination protein RmuC [Lysobacter terrestris]QNP42133.1 DNA recombination protein RmuC [Lysobacter terrestris]